MYKFFTVGYDVEIMKRKYKEY